MTEWQSPIGTVVGNASPSEFVFILKSFKSRVGDIVAVRMEVPDDGYQGREVVYVWGRITSIDRFNPFFPFEAAQELSHEGISIRDTILSESRDQLQASVRVLGATKASDAAYANIFPLTYPVQPAGDVYYPPAAAVQALLATAVSQTPIKIGTLIARGDVQVNISADRLVARHMAILAMTGAGKTVAARRILRELIGVGYPILIFDPHGDYVGLWEKRSLFPDSTIRLFFPHLRLSEHNMDIIEDLISKMTEGLTSPQRDYLGRLLARDDLRPAVGQPVLQYLETLTRVAEAHGAHLREREARRRFRRGEPEPENEDQGEQIARWDTINAVRRTLNTIKKRLEQMEQTNHLLRTKLKHLQFEMLPDAQGHPEGIIAKRQVSILYLGGYDHLTQSTIVSIVLDTLFEYRASLSERIPPFTALIEEAHNFIPSAREGTAETPSLQTIRRVITEGRKFGTGLILLTQRPSRVDETILSQCNSFLVLRLVNPKDQSFVRSVMENLEDADARMLPGFGPGQGLISGQSVRFPLLVKIARDEDIEHSALGDENFIEQAARWKPEEKAEARDRAAGTSERLAALARTRKG